MGLGEKINWRRAGRVALFIILLAIVIGPGLAYHLEERWALRQTRNDGRPWPITAEVLGKYSASPVMLGDQLHIIIVARQQGQGTVLTPDVQQLIELYIEGIREWEKHSPNLNITCEVQVVRISANPATAKEGTVEKQIAAAFLGQNPDTTDPFLDLLNYANQRRENEGWDGVSIGILPEGRKDTAEAWLNGPYAWIPLVNPSYRAGDPVKRGIPAHEFAHLFGARDKYRKREHQIGGVNAVRNGSCKDGIMAEIPTTDSPFPVCATTLGQIFGADDDRDGIPNPLDVIPTIEEVVRWDDSTVGTTVFRATLHPGWFTPTNLAFLGGGNDRLVIETEIAAEAWFWTGDSWERVVTLDSPEATSNETVIEFSVPMGSRTAVKVTNSAGNKAHWCWGPCPDPWPAHTIFLPAVFRNYP